MSKSIIVKSAVKLEKFKTLMAHTISTGITFAPVFGIYSLIAFPALRAEHASAMQFLSILVGIGLAIGQMILIFHKHNEYSRISWGPFRPAHNNFWKRMLDKPFMFLFRKNNEEIILRTRKMMRNGALEQSDYDWLSQKIYEKDLIKKDYQEWLEILGDHCDRYNRFFPTKLKEESAQKALDEVAQEIEKRNPGYLKNYADNKKHTKFLKGNLSLLDFAQHSNSYDSYELKALIEDKKQVLLNPKFDSLKTSDYSNFKSLVKSEEVNSINHALSLLCLADYPKVDWERIQDIIQDNYKFHDNYYESWMREMSEKLVVQSSKKSEFAILANIGHTTLDAPTPDSLPVNINVNTSPMAAMPVNALDKKMENLDKFSNLVNYNSSIVPELWAELKEEYSIVFQLKERLPSTTFIEFNSQISTVLPLLIGVDVSFKASNQDYPEQSKQLVKENLDILIEKAKSINLNIKESLNRDLEVASRYQNNKKMSASS